MADVVNIMARKSEGAVLPEPMMRRLEKFNMNLRQDPKTFRNQLKNFQQEVANLIREEKQLAMTTRRDLATQAGRTSPHSAFSPVEENE